MIQRLNVTPERERDGADGFDADDLAAVREANALDTELYDFARDVFEERFAILRDLMVRRQARSMPTAWHRICIRPSWSAIALSRDWHRQPLTPAPASSCPAVDNWFFYAPVSRWLRWAGPECQSSLYLPLDRATDRRIKIEIVFTLSDGIRDALSIEVDDRVLPTARSYEKFEDDQWHLMLEVVVPAAVPGAAEPQYTEIRFRAPDVVQTEIDGRPDTPRSFAIGRMFIS